MKTKAEKQTGVGKGQFALLSNRRFGPYFWTQAWGAFNDNFFKTALAVLLAFDIAAGKTSSHLMVNLAAGLFILPFVLFAGPAGRMADKYEQSGWIQRIKAAEIVIMAFGALSLVSNQIWLQLATLFAMGAQSAFFGPVKYSAPPHYLKPDELVGGNAMVEMGTFAAILLGTMAGGVLITVDGGRWWVSLGIITVAVAGWCGSRRIPAGRPANPALDVKWSLVSEINSLMRLVRGDTTVLSILAAISWFWFMGAAYVTQLPLFVREVLNGAPEHVTPLLAAFTIGVAVGSLLCERLSGKQVEPGLIPLGALSMGVGGALLVAFSSGGAAAGPPAGFGFLDDPRRLGIVAALSVIGLGGGLYTVPLFTLMQTQAPPRKRSRIVAANNMLNALAIVAASALAALLLAVCRLPVTGFFAVLSVISFGFSIVVAVRIPRSVLRMMIWLATRFVYKIRCTGLDHIPQSGPAVLVCNHVSYVDALIIGGSCRRPVRFVMHKDYYRLPALRWLFRIAKSIPIDSARKNPAVLHRALNEIDTALGAGELVCLFPEGGLTRDGEIGRFRPGIEKIIKRNSVPVIPLALFGLWGSVFSRKDRRFAALWSRKARARINLVAGARVAPQSVRADHLRTVVVNLMETAAFPG